jgi:hypothetical protein
VARQRDYRAEYQRRQQAARAAGWQSYWHERQTRKAAQDYTGASRRAFISVAKNPPPGESPAAVRALWAEGDEAMRAGDLERAREIAERLGIRPARGKDGTPYPPESAFWYH